MQSFRVWNGFCVGTLRSPSTFRMCRPYRTLLRSCYVQVCSVLCAAGHPLTAVGAKRQLRVRGLVILPAHREGTTEASNSRLLCPHKALLHRTHVASTSGGVGPGGLGSMAPGTSTPRQDSPAAIRSSPACSRSISREQAVSWRDGFGGTRTVSIRSIPDWMHRLPSRTASGGHGVPAPETVDQIASQRAHAQANAHSATGTAASWRQSARPANIVACAGSPTHHPTQVLDEHRINEIVTFVSFSASESNIGPASRKRACSVDCRGARRRRPLVRLRAKGQTAYARSV